MTGLAPFYQYYRYFWRAKKTTNMNNIIFEFLKTKVSLFQYFSDNPISKIIDESRLPFYEQNEAVARFGEENLFLGVVIEGELSASVIGEGDICKEIPPPLQRDCIAWFLKVIS